MTMGKGVMVFVGTMVLGLMAGGTANAKEAMALEPPPFQAGLVAPAPAAPEAASQQSIEPRRSTTTLKTFQTWLRRDVGWTQRQRLRHIRNEWMATLKTLSGTERVQAAIDIAAVMKSPRIAAERELVLDEILTDAPADVTLASR